jgi:phosphohistidine phosphatase
VIWFLRHAEAVDGTPDHLRELTDKGRRQSEAAGKGLAALGVEFDLCLTSPKVRARDTALIACEQLGIEPVEDEALSGGPFDPEALAGDLPNVLLVGHEPVFSMAVADLTGARIEMKKAGVAAVEGRTLLRLLRQPELRALADLR